VDLKVHASISTEAHQLLKDEASRSFKDRINDRKDQSSVCLAFVLVQKDCVLNVEVRLIVV
jgi:hypothetical protein